MRRTSVKRLVTLTVASLGLVAGVLVGAASPAQAATVPGIDVSRYQGAITWTSVRNAGIQFAFIKATEGITLRDSRFSANYPAAHRAGVIRGAYHFARPSSSSGAAQANFFASNGGAWSRDNRTLPGALDLEAGCYGKTPSAMVAWIRDFLTTYFARTRRHAVIYTTTSWWLTCTGNYAGFAVNNPLWIARWASTPGALPAGWRYYTFWQYTDRGRVAGITGNVDRDYFNGTRTRLLALANNT